MIRPGFYMSGGESGQPDPLRLYCDAHIDRACHLFNLFTGGDVAPDPCWAGDDGFEHCRICGVLLDTGGLSEIGVDEALEYGPAELSDDEIGMVEASMSYDDPRLANIVAEITRRAVAASVSA